MKTYNFKKVGAYIFIDVLEGQVNNATTLPAETTEFVGETASKPILIESIEFPISNSRMNSIYGSVATTPNVDFANPDVVRNPLLNDGSSSETASQLNSFTERIGVSILSNNLNLITIQKGSEEEITFEEKVLDENGEWTGEVESVTETRFVENQFVVDELNIGFEQLVFEYLANNTGFALTSIFTQESGEAGVEIPKPQL
jgi:hypothetical protein